MRSRLRWAAAGTYAVALVVVAFWPTPVDRPAAGLIAEVVAWCHAHGFAFVSHSFFEQAANVALFVPLGAVLASLMHPAGRAAAGACMAVSLLFEARPRGFRRFRATLGPPQPDFVVRFPGSGWSHSQPPLPPARVAYTNEAVQTGGMTVSLETWVSIGTLLGVGAGILIAIRAMGAELKGDIARLDDRVSRLDDRVYALAVGLRPQLEDQRTKDAPSAG